MPALDDILLQKLQLLESKQQKRALVQSAPENGVRIVRTGKTYISFSSNDYLGLSQHPQVKAAAIAATQKYGTGAGASRLVTGSHPLYDELETELARYKGTQAACIFGSGYLANVGTIPALVGKGDLIIADRLIHACMIDAAKLSGATLLRFAHNNSLHCNELLIANRSDHQNCLILTETVFSMDGDRAPLAALSALAKSHDAWLMSDDAHGLGLSDDEENGRMTDDEKKSNSSSSSVIRHPSSVIQMGTLSKAAGSYGGYVCGSKTLVDYLHNSARSLVYSTGLPPATVAASLAAIKLMQAEPELCKKPLHQAQHFTRRLGLPDAQSAIVPVVLGENDKALKASSLLLEHGFLVSAIRPPTVPENTARLRFAFSALHTTEQIDAVADVLLKHEVICKP